MSSSPPARQANQCSNFSEVNLCLFFNLSSFRQIESNVTVFILALYFFQNESNLTVFYSSLSFFARRKQSSGF